MMNQYEIIRNSMEVVIIMIHSQSCTDCNKLYNMILNHAKKVENITDEEIKMEAMKLADKAAPKSP